MTTPHGIKSWRIALELYELRVQKPGIRYERNFDVTLQEWKNMFEGKCFCGKPKSQWEEGRRRYCSEDCYIKWNYDKHCFWEHFRYVIFKRDNYTCTVCGKKLRKKGPGGWYQETSYEVDHIVALIFGGMCFDKNNVRTLCSICHKEKTKSDMQILSWYRKESNYDPKSDPEKDNQMVLEEFLIESEMYMHPS